MIELSVFVMGATYILSLPAFMRLQRLNVSHLLVYIGPIAPQVLWWALTVAGIGEQSLRNIIEVVFIGPIVVVTSYICAFVIADKVDGRKLGRIFLGIILGGTIMLRIFMPDMQE